MIFFVFLAAWVLFFAAKATVETVARLRPVVVAASPARTSAPA